MSLPSSSSRRAPLGDEPKRLSEATIRRSFINRSRGEATRTKLPADSPDTPWDDLDFYGWIHPSAPLRATIVVPDDNLLRSFAFGQVRERLRIAFPVDEGLQHGVPTSHSRTAWLVGLQVQSGLRLGQATA